MVIPQSRRPLVLPHSLFTYLIMQIAIKIDDYQIAH